MPENGNFDIICGEVPVVDMSSSSCLDQIAADLLQAAVSTSRKVDNCWVRDDPPDRDVAQALEDIELNPRECWCARSSYYPECRAVGTSRRSMMVALTLSIVLKYPNHLDRMWRTLEMWSAEKIFRTMVQDLKELKAMGTGAGKAGESRNVSLDGLGVQMQMVGNGIPIIELCASSIFSDSVKFLLQTAMDFTGKADALIDYVEANEQPKLFKDLKRLGYRPDDVLVAKCRHGTPIIHAAGLNGKKAAMLAVLVAAMMHGKANIMHIEKELLDGGYDYLCEPLRTLLLAAEDLSGIEIECLETPRAGRTPPWRRDSHDTRLRSRSRRHGGRPHREQHYCSRHSRSRP